MSFISTLKSFNTRLFLNKTFVTAGKFLGKNTLGSDLIMYISGYELLTFFVKVSGLPAIKNDEPVQLVTRGVKTSIPNYVQTENTIQISFNEKDSLLVKTLIETILLEGKNGNLELNFFMGRILTDMQLWGQLAATTISFEDLPQASVTDTTEPLELTITATGHYIPNTAQRAWAYGSAIVNALDNPVVKKLF